MRVQSPSCYHVSDNTCGARCTSTARGHRSLWRGSQMLPRGPVHPRQGGRHTSAGAGAGCSSPSTVGRAQITEGTRRTEAATRQIPSSAVNPLRQGGACVGPKCRVSQWSMSDSAEGLSQSFQEAGGPPPYTRIAQPLVRPLVHLLPYPGLKFRSCPPPNSIGYRGVCSPSPRM